MKNHDAEGGGFFDMANVRAIAWAQEHAGETITSDDQGSELLDETRNLIRGTIVRAVTEGWSSQKLTSELRANYAFSRDRAETISRTELAMAYSNGAMQSYITSNVVKRKRWLLDADQCPLCRANADEGEIPLRQPFKSGHMTTPAHDSCRCCVVPVVAD